MRIVEGERCSSVGFERDWWVCFDGDGEKTQEILACLGNSFG